MSILKKTKTDIKEAICSAIKLKRVIKFDYHDGLHHVEPFCLGVLPGGTINEALRCYQVSGQSLFDSPNGWKLYRVSDISSVEITTEQFTGNRPGYDRDNSEMATVYCVIALDIKDGVKRKQAVNSTFHSDKPILDYEQPTSRILDHNTLMKRFRLSHIKFPSGLFWKRNKS